MIGHSSNIHLFKNTIKMDWIEEDNQLKKSFEFEDFVAAMSFMTEVSYHAEKQNHHPDWTNVYNKVKVNLSTHDAGNIVTDKDRKLAKAMDLCYQKYRK